jgi:hypothetical protein
MNEEIKNSNLNNQAEELVDVSKNMVRSFLRLTD